jgi:hypothetical protein
MQSVRNSVQPISPYQDLFYLRSNPPSLLRPPTLAWRSNTVFGTRSHVTLSFREVAASPVAP